MKKTRLDALLVQRGFIDSRERAKAIIMSGNVFVAGQRSDKPGNQIDSEAEIEVRSLPEYVSRGGQKLEKALKFFGVSPKGKVCIDCGASTGGFTDCLLQNGAKMVYAIDVGYGQLAWKVRNDPRVITMERTNIRYVTAEMFMQNSELATIDVSFISLALVLPVLKSLLTEDGEVVCLIKPQFEAGREKVGKKGVVKDKTTHMQVLEDFLRFAEVSGFFVRSMTYSPVRGPEGNIEYLAWLCGAGEGALVDIEAIVAAAHSELTM
ncbi:MAG: TlyA family RNA methyltransferase [Oscillospiraceae bacterium]|nr:TlyA family RNA methyltransferase [Oscillospiraceae bacterium]